MVILSPKLNADDANNLNEGLLNLVVENGGEIIKTDPWGKRLLAYPIKKFVEGNYALLRFKLEPSYVLELRQKLEADESILRYLVIKKG